MNIGPHFIRASLLSDTQKAKVARLSKGLHNYIEAPQWNMGGGRNAK